MKKNENNLISIIKSNLFAVVLFLGIAVLMVVSFKDTSDKRKEQAKQSAEESILRAIVTCYAIEGSYPESYSYIKDNYGVYINENKLTVFYTVFGSNIMPDFRIIDKG